MGEWKGDEGCNTAILIYRVCSLVSLLNKMWGLYSSHTAPTLKRIKSLSVLDGDAVLSGNDDRSSHANEEAVLDGSDDLVNLIGQGDGILDGLVKVHVHEVALVVGDGNLLSVNLVVGAAAAAEDSLGALHGGEGLEVPHGVLDAEGEALNGKGEGRAEGVDDLGLVNDHDELVSGGLNDLPKFTTRSERVTS